MMNDILCVIKYPIFLALSIFLIVLWIQTLDDKKYNKKRTSYYHKFKLPLLISSILYICYTSIPSINTKKSIKQDIFTDPLTIYT
jgi:hypothetical protein